MKGIVEKAEVLAVTLAVGVLCLSVPVGHNNAKRTIAGV